MNGSRVIGLAIAAWVFAFFPVYGQQTSNTHRPQTPTLAETERWIAQTFGTGDHWSPSFMHTAMQAIYFDFSDKSDGTQCYMSFEVRNGDLDDILIRHEPNIRFRQVIDLGDIDPTSITFGRVVHDTKSVTDTAQPDISVSDDDHPYVMVTIKTTDNKPSIRTESFGKISGLGPPPYRSKDYQIGFSNPDGIAVDPNYAPRFVKAMRHAVELCGGRKSAF